jgi:type I restriction enzyme M protein
MAIKKSELYSSIWASCDELRGGMDASQYKDYVLVLLFIKYISDKYVGKPYAQITIPLGASFQDMVALKGKPTIGDDINKKIIGPITEANKLGEMPDFNSPDKLGSGKEMVDRLTNLITIFENPALDFSQNRAGGDDILGDAYEYLMRKFATQSGKSKGNFYTPAEVSRIIAKVIGISNNTNSSTTAYDPTCGSGSLLLRVADESEAEISLYGQEKEVATAGLAIMNMVIHKYATAEIAKGQSTLSNPLHINKDGSLKTFDFVVANPPFSYKSWTNGFALQAGSINDPHNRFTGFGIPPKKNGDYAFLLHIIRSMKSRGKGAVVLPHGVLFRGNAEAEIRRNVIKRGYIKGIIGLPPNLFYGTGIPACIVVLDKEDTENRKGIFIIDASKGFVKDGDKNRLREQDIHKIVDAFSRQIEIEGYSRNVPFTEIEKNDYNLNIPRYIDSQEREDVQNIEAHLLGGIPNTDIDALQQYWQACPSLKEALFSGTNRQEYSKLKIEPDEIRATINSHPEFVTYADEIMTLFNQWKERSNPILKTINSDIKPKQVIHELSEDLLQTFTGFSLIDKYDIYQRLMAYWYDTMQDDVYAIVDSGWEAGKAIEQNNKKKNVWEGRIIPKHIIISQYFESEQKSLEQLEVELDNTSQQMDEMIEENSGEDGLLSEVINDKGKINKGDIQKRVKEIYCDADFADEMGMLNAYLSFMDRETSFKKKIKETAALLDAKLKSKYKSLREEDVKTLIVDCKWLAALEKLIEAEVQHVSQTLTSRIKELSDRYECTLPELSEEVTELDKKVNSHLKKMGYRWE